MPLCSVAPAEDMLTNACFEPVMDLLLTNFPPDLSPGALVLLTQPNFHLELFP